MLNKKDGLAPTEKRSQPAVPAMGLLVRINQQPIAGHNNPVKLIYIPITDAPRADIDRAGGTHLPHYVLAHCWQTCPIDCVDVSRASWLKLLAVKSNVIIP